MKRPLPAFVRLVLLPALLGTALTSAALLVPHAGWTTHDVTTGQSADYPDLQTHDYDASPPNALAVAAAEASRLPGWKAVHRDPVRGTLDAEVRRLGSFFTDDVTVSVTPTGANGDSARVSIRSRSRGGGGDLGANARHIRALQAAMDGRLPTLPH